MHLTPSDPDIATIVRKIEEGRLDLQPNFQRGEVWGKPKKQRLIDSILRGWHIPPIHVIQVANSSKQEVLDGQQRLAAIRDFFRNEFAIVGTLEPEDVSLSKLDGLFFKDLDTLTKGYIEDFTIRILTISDYKIGEPGELFYRLNQPTNLTSAEHRNAYFGEARQQVKQIVDLLLKFNFNTQSIGFSNSRMAYDDVIAKCLITIESESFSVKMTSNLVTSRYRDIEGFSESLIMQFEKVIVVFNEAVENASEKLKLNKATFYSWLIFYYQLLSKIDIDPKSVGNYFYKFEKMKSLVNEASLLSEFVPRHYSIQFIRFILDVFIDRSSSRVSDLSSVKLRDFIIWNLFLLEHPEIIEQNSCLKKINSSFAKLGKQVTFNEKDLLSIVSENNWEGLVE
jgi:hypothetical protein